MLIIEIIFYRDTGNLNRRSKLHNKALSKARVSIENTFGILKGRWRILHFVNVYKIEKVINIISATCMLHNFCLLQNDEFECEPHSVNMNEALNAEYAALDEVEGLNKRLHIANSII